MRKVNANARLESLTAAQRERVFEHCADISLEAGSDWLRTEYDVRIHPSNLSRWLEKRRAEKDLERMLAEIRTEREFAEQITAEAGKTATLGDASAALLQQLVFGLLRRPEGRRDPEQIALLMGHALKVRDQELKAAQIDLQERRLQLLEKQSEQAKATLGDSKLSPAEREERMREIFGLQKAA